MGAGPWAEQVLPEARFPFFRHGSASASEPHGKSGPPRPPGLGKGVWAGPSVPRPCWGSLSSWPHPGRRAALQGTDTRHGPRAQALLSPLSVSQHPPHPKVGNPAQSEELVAWPGGCLGCWPGRGGGQGQGSKRPGLPFLGSLGWARDQPGQLEAPPRAWWPWTPQAQASQSTSPSAPKAAWIRGWLLAGAQSRCPVHVWGRQGWHPHTQAAPFMSSVCSPVSEGQAVSKQGASEPGCRACRFWCGTRQGRAQGPGSQERPGRGSTGQGATAAQPQRGPWMQGVPGPIAAGTLWRVGFNPSS